MATVIRLYRSLDVAPTVRAHRQATVRSYRDHRDGLSWLRLHALVFRRPAAARDWTEADFRREFIDRPGWDPRHMWFAEVAGHVVGTVTLKIDPRTASGGTDDRATLERSNLPNPTAAGAPTEAADVVHSPRAVLAWLAVDPVWRRKGIGRLLVGRLECRCWELGARRIELETYTRWPEAIAFYGALGYSRQGAARRQNNDV